ncbi:hypothetical protein NMA58_09755 [Rhizobium sp. YTUHZ045]|uniref:hypothetical protein n=1 Tax=Rhizobium sp. YTUHZ045 TaxID=2962888 RepID=UPI003DA8FDE3
MAVSEIIGKIKAFDMTNQMLAEDLSSLERHFDIRLGHLPVPSEEVEREYYPQLEADLRAEGAKMARHYEVFYSLEKSIRRLVTETFEAIRRSATGGGAKSLRQYEMRWTSG